MPTEKQTTAVDSMKNLSTRERADMRHSGAIRRSHKSIQSIELRMRKWLGNRPIFSQVFNISKEGTLKEKVLATTVKAMLAGIAGTYVVRHTGVSLTPEQIQAVVATVLPAKAVAALAPHMWQAAFAGGTVLASYKAYDYVSKYVFGAALMAATAKDAHQLSQKLGSIKSREWMQQNISIIHGASFREPTTLLRMCKEIVERAHAERAPELTDSIGKTKQLDMWAADLAIAIGQKARLLKNDGDTPRLAVCVTMALNDAPWASKTINALKAIDLVTENPAAAGQLKFEYEFVSKPAFNPAPNLYDMDAFEMPNPAKYFSEDRKTRLGALSARFENAMLTNDTYKYLVTSNFIGRAAAGALFAATVAALATRSIGNLISAPNIFDIAHVQAIGVFCAQHSLVNTPTFVLRMIDRASVIGMHSLNQFDIKHRLLKLDYEDKLLQQDYGDLAKYVEGRYNTHIASRMNADHSSAIREQTTKINTDFYVAQTIASAIETKLMNRTLSLESLINDTIQETCLEAEGPQKKGVQLAGLARPQDAVFGTAPKLNLAALGKAASVKNAETTSSSPSL